MGELIENVEEELDEIAAELGKLKRRLDACLKFKQKDLLCKIKKLNDQIQTEQEATELARFEELNKLSKDSKKCNEDSPMEMTKRRAKYKRKKSSTKGAKINRNQENNKKGSNSSKFSTPIKESDTEPVIHVMKKHQNREINKNDENYKK